MSGAGPVFDLTVTALKAARRGEEEQTAGLIQRIYDEHGIPGVSTAIGLWCDTIIQAMPSLDSGTPPALDYDSADFGHVWAVLLINARAARDDDTASGLLNEVGDGQVLGDLVLSLVMLIGANLRVLQRAAGQVRTEPDELS